MPFGRPTKYNEKMLQKAKAYYLSFIEAEPFLDEDQKIKNPRYNYPPYIEELSLELDVDDDTIVEWSKIHKDFSATIKKIKKLQKLRLYDKSMQKSSTTGAIFQLKVNHGMIETSKTDITSGGETIVGFNYLPNDDNSNNSNS